MAFLTLNGITIPVFKDDLQEVVKDVGDEPIDGALGVVMATRVAKLRRWRFRTGLLRNDEYRAYQAWIEGFGATWEFTSRISGQGYTHTVLGTWALAAGAMAVGSGSHFSAQMRYRMGVQRAAGWAPSDGYTMFCRRTYVAGETSAAGAHHNLLTGTADFVRGASANPANVNQYVDGVLNNSANLGRCYSVSLTSPFCGLHGVKTDNTNSAITYDSWVFLPFRLPSITTSTGLTEAQWAAAIAAQHTANWSQLPRLAVGGDCLEGETGVLCVGRVKTLKQAFGRKAGMSAADNNLRDLEVELFETLDA